MFKVRKAFTLLELLLVIAIIASLAGLILAALNPAQRLDEASEVKAVSSGNDVEKAIKAYTVENAGVLPTGLSALTISGIYDVCKSGETIGCINLDQLVTSGKISSIPTDIRYATTHTSGYKVAYNTTTTEAKVYSQTEYTEATKYCPPGDNCVGPISEWLFDEGSGTIARDTTGNRNGTLTSGPLWATGYKNSGIQFDGLDDYINLSSAYTPGSGEFTVSGWFNLNSSQAASSNQFTIFGNNQNTPFFGYRPSTKRFAFCPDGGGLASAATVNNLADSQWHHAAMVVNRTNNTISFYVDGVLLESQASTATFTGNQVLSKLGNSYLPSAVTQWNGLLDELRLYNYARTPAQVTWEYNQGLPIARWKFDETSGTSAADSSGSGYTGTLTSGPTWVAGKYGNGINFDGVDDYVSLPSISNLGLDRFSVCAWMNGTQATDILAINVAVAVGDGTGPRTFWSGIHSTNDDYMISMGNVPTDVGLNVFKNTGWHFVCGVKEADGISGYIDGRFVSKNTNATSTLTNTNMRIGNFVTGSIYFKGVIDEVRAYNYVLTPSQVMQAMHER